MTSPGTAVGRRAWFGVAGGMFAVAWGANQFVSLLVVYKTDRGISTPVNDALFGIYALALIGALLLGGPAADLYGRARIVAPSVLLSLIASVLLMVGDHSVPLLFAGRFAAGVASGGIFAAGSAWVKELSRDAAEDAGARRAALALSLGFGVGPLVTGLVAQWSPDPLVFAYVPHLLITLLAAPAVLAAPETVTRESVTPERVTPDRPRGYAARLRVRSATDRRFLRVVAPAAPWVFGAPSVAFVVLPGIVGPHLHGYGPVFSGVVATATLGTGVAIQPVARRWDRPGRVTSSLVGLGALLAGLAVGVVAAATTNWVLVIVAALPLGAAYGFGLVSGLLETQRIARTGELAGLTGVFYALTYVGFALPLLLAWLHDYATYPVLLAGVGVVGMISAAVVLIARDAPISGDDGGRQPGTLRSESAADVK